MVLVRDSNNSNDQKPFEKGVDSRNGVDIDSAKWMIVRPGPEAIQSSLDVGIYYYILPQSGGGIMITPR